MFATRTTTPGDGGTGTGDGGTGTGSGDGTGSDGGGSTSGDGAGQPTPLTIRLAPKTTTLPAATLRFRLAAFPVAVTGTARLTTGRLTLARATWSAKAGHAPSIELRRTAAGRRWIRTHRRGQVRLAISAHPTDATSPRVVTEAFRLRLR